MFGWNFILLVDLYLDIFNFVAGYYITQTQDREKGFFIYDLYTLLLAEQNFNTHKPELVVILKFRTKYFHMPNVKHQSIIYMDYKLHILFFNAKYHEDIIMHQVNKLCLFNIRIQYILRKKNMIGDGLSQVIFNNSNCFYDQLMNKLAKNIFLY